jgi:hypothetical protein
MAQNGQAEAPQEGTSGSKATTMDDGTVIVDERGVASAGRSGSGAEIQLGVASAGRSGSGAEMQLCAAAAVRGCSCARLQLCVAAAGRGRSGRGAEIQLSAAEVGCGRSGAALQRVRVRLVADAAAVCCCNGAVLQLPTALFLSLQLCA